MELVHDIPNWLIFQICRTTSSARLRKQPLRYSASYYQRAPGIYSNPTDRTHEHRQKFYQHLWPPQKAPEGNLSSNEYRFWWGSKLPEALYSRCRYCGSLCFNRAERIRHQRFVGDYCTQNLRAAYKWLLEHGDCVVCQRPTTNTKWGIPICSVTCEIDWKFTARDYIILKNAVQIQRLHGLIKERKDAQANTQVHRPTDRT